MSETKLPRGTVIVLDTSNYTNGEPVPFKALVLERYDHEVVVKSCATGREYELYYSQVLESLDIEEIRRLIDMSKYGE